MFSGEKVGEGKNSEAESAQSVHVDSRILNTLPPDDQIKIVRNNKNRKGYDGTNFAISLEDFQTLSPDGRDRIMISVLGAAQGDSVNNEPRTQQESTAVAPVTNQGERNEQKKGGISRRNFLLGAAALGLTGVGVALAGRAAGARGAELDGSTSSEGNVDPDTLNGIGETDKYSTIREVFSHIDEERFANDEGLILNDTGTVGGHLKAWEAGQEAGNERMMHWVAYKKDLLSNPDFLDKYAGDSFEGLSSADDYGAFYEHIAYTTRPVAAADLIALRHPEFAGLSLEEAESKLKGLNDYSPDEAASYKKWLQGQYASGKTEYKFVDILDGNYLNLGIVDKNAEHGMFTECDAAEILRDEKNQLVEATTSLGNGVQVTRYINPVCMNILNKIKINGKTFIISENEPPKGQPDEPKTPDNPETPDDPDKPEEELESKDYENMERIDNNIQNDIADDIGTEEVNIPQTTAEDQPVTSQPEASSYEGTSATTVENSSSQGAESIVEDLSPENDYSQDLGGANSGYTPVEPDTSAPLVEDAAPPTTATEADDILGELGIN